MSVIKGRQGVANPAQYSFPVATKTIKTPIRKNNPFASKDGAHPGVEINEIRPYSPQEISDMRKNFAQNGIRDAEYMCKLWENGADTIMLSSSEMAKLRNIVENPAVTEALEHVIEMSKEDNHPLMDWVTAAWRLAFPTLDLTQFEAKGKWSDYGEAIQLCRKLGVLYLIYNQVPTPQASPLTPQFKKIILKGAPPNLKLSIAGPLQACTTIAEAIRMFKECRELETDKVISFAAQVPPKKRKTFRTPFTNIREAMPGWKKPQFFGDQRPRMPIRQPNNQMGPGNRIWGTKIQPWGQRQPGPRPIPCQNNNRSGYFLARGWGTRRPPPQNKSARPGWNLGA